MRRFTMNTLYKIALPALFLSLAISFSDAQAQFRDDLKNSNNYTGSIIKTDNQQRNANLGLGGLLQDFNMSHSYSMTFSSMGGNYQNINAYTNTMHLKFSDDLTGRVDLSLLHSPFGSSTMYGSNEGLDSQILIENAQLNYQLSENSSISFQFRQMPASYSSYGYGTGSMYSPFSNNYGTRSNFSTYDNPFRN